MIVADHGVAEVPASVQLTKYKPSPSYPVVVGVDVGGRKKGFHAVALFNGRRVDTFTTRNVAKVAAWCQKLNAFAVGVDAPCCWSLTGRARACERALAVAGMTSFATPSQLVGERHPFYGWMLNGAQLFGLLKEKEHYRLFDGSSPTSSPVCFETFPHAVACALAGKKLAAKHKRIDRPNLLRDAGLSLDSLSNIDFVDAGLCALTAHHLLAGTFKIYGDVPEGFIIVPSLGVQQKSVL